MQTFPCDFRGSALPPQKCPVCGPDKDRDIEVFQCHELERPCSVHAHNLREGGTRTGRKMLVCIKCEHRSVNGEPVGKLSAIEIQAARREADAQPRRPCELQRKLAGNIVRIREAAELSPGALATAAGCHVLLLERIEGAEHWPSPERLAAIAQALQVPPSALFA